MQVFNKVVCLEIRLPQGAVHCDIMLVDPKYKTGEKWLWHGRSRPEAGPHRCFYLWLMRLLAREANPYLWLYTSRIDLGCSWHNSLPSNRLLIRDGCNSGCSLNDCYDGAMRLFYKIFLSPAMYLVDRSWVLPLKTPHFRIQLCSQKCFADLNLVTMLTTATSNRLVRHETCNTPKSRYEIDPFLKTSQGFLSSPGQSVVSSQ